MNKFAYYNEIDPYAAQWLRNLIEAGHIPPGVVDERSIKDVVGSDLQGFSQCHFFAGIGVWAYALRRAGWRDDQPVWTGSCPCQPFSSAGKGAGFDDERHLWPEWIRLIRECGPGVVFGEQVASKDGLGWLDFVHADLEDEGYAVGAFDICAAGVGAPHIRQRLYFAAERVGYTYDSRLEGRRSGHRAARGRIGAVGSASTASEPGRLADDDDDGFAQQRLGGLLDGERPALGHDADGRGAVCGVADAAGVGSSTRARIASVHDGAEQFERPGVDRHAGPTNGYWRDADWLGCRDGKWRPVEPGSFPLVNGTSARVGRLRAYGNAIVAPLAEDFIRAFLDARPEYHNDVVADHKIASWGRSC